MADEKITVKERADKKGTFVEYFSVKISLFGEVTVERDIVDAVSAFERWSYCRATAMKGNFFLSRIDAERVAGVIRAALDEQRAKAKGDFIEALDALAQTSNQTN